MKIDLKDVTFLILIRTDSIQRLENVLTVLTLLSKYFKTKIILREASSYDNRILSCLLQRNKLIDYFFVEDKDPVLHKTRHFNEMIERVQSPYIAIWDADIIPDKKTILNSVSQLRNNDISLSYPYNGFCYDISGIIREMFLSKKDIRFLYRHKNKMNLLHKHSLVGGAVFMKKSHFYLVGLENERHYGWGNDDFDRYFRFEMLDLGIHRENVDLFHLSHPRNNNSFFTSDIHEMISKKETFVLSSSSKKDLSCKFNI